MFASPPVLTEVGITILLRAAAGEEFTLTKFQAGDGLLEPGETPETRVRLKHMTLDDIPIIEVDDTTEDYLTLQGRFDNQTNITADFDWRELGLIAEDEDGREYLYAYAYNIDYPELIRAGGGSVMLEQFINLTVPVGDSGNITAEEATQEEYAKAVDFSAHVANTGSEHEAAHHETYQQIGAAAASHAHGAADIVSGILPIARGGTGVNSIQELNDLIGEKIKVGMYIGDGTARRDITLGFKPSHVLLYNAEDGEGIGLGYPAFAFWEGHNVYYKDLPASAMTESADMLFARRMGGAAVTDTGFAVGYVTPPSGGQHIWVNGTNHLMIYFAAK